MSFTLFVEPQDGFASAMVTKLPNATTGTIDVQAIVAFFGGRQTLVADLKQFQIIEITPAAIDKWVIRGIPAARRIDLQTLARLKRMKFSFDNFMAKPATKKKVA